MEREARSRGREKCGESRDGVFSPEFWPKNKTAPDSASRKHQFFSYSSLERPSAWKFGVQVGAWCGARFCANLEFGCRRIPKVFEKSRNMSDIADRMRTEVGTGMGS